MSRLVLVLVGLMVTGSQALAVDCPVLSNKLLGSYCAGKKFFGLNKMPEGLYDENGMSATIFLDKCPFFLFNIGKKKILGSTRAADMIGQTPVPWNLNSLRFLNDMKINPTQQNQYEVKHCKYELRHETGSQQVKQAHIFVVGKKTSTQDMRENAGIIPQTGSQEGRFRAPSRVQQPIFEPEPIQEQKTDSFMNHEENPYQESDNSGFGNEEHYPLSNTTPEPIFENDSEHQTNSFSPPPPPPGNGFGEENYFDEENSNSFSPPPPPPGNGFGEENYFDEGNTDSPPPPPPPPGNGFGEQNSYSPPPPPPYVGTKTDGNNRGFLSGINKGVGKNLKPVDRSNQPPRISEDQQNLGNVLGNVLEKRRAAIKYDDFDEEDEDTDFGGPSNDGTPPMPQQQPGPPVVQQQPVVEKQPLSKPIVGSGKKWTAPSVSSSEPSSSGGGLLDQIRKGAALKKTEHPTEKPTTQENTSGFNTDLLNKVKKHQNPVESDDNNSEWDD